jgi:hypothetical protein
MQIFYTLGNTNDSRLKLFIITMDSHKIRLYSEFIWIPLKHQHISFVIFYTPLKYFRVEQNYEKFYVVFIAMKELLCLLMGCAVKVL